MSMSLPLLPGLVSGSRRSLTIGCEERLLTIIVLRSLFLLGHSTDRAPVEPLRLQMNFLTLLSIVWVTRIHGLARRGKRAENSLSSSRSVEPYWFCMAW